MTKTYNDIDAVTRLLEEVSDSGKGKESFIIDWLQFISIKADIIFLGEECQKLSPLRV